MIIWKCVLFFGWVLMWLLCKWDLFLIDKNLGVSVVESLFEIVFLMVMFMFWKWSVRIMYKV